MKYTPDEIAELLKDKPHQPHYIAAMVRKAVEAERERCAALCDSLPKSEMEYMAQKMDDRITAAQLEMEDADEAAEIARLRRCERRLAAKNDRTQKMRRFQIWAEGYRATGDSSDATLMGEHDGETFRAACDAFAEQNERFRECYDSLRLTYWGCRLFDNETDARKAFG